MRFLIKSVAAFLGLAVQLPIGLWLQYKMLVKMEATELMMFLYWVNVPLIIVTSFIFKILEDKSNEGENR